MPDHLKAILTLNLWRFALGTGALYAVLGCLWIVVSDSLVSSVSSDPARVATVQRYKGVFYVFATSLSLIFLVRSGFQRLLQAASRVEGTTVFVSLSPSAAEPCPEEAESLQAV